MANLVLFFLGVAVPLIILVYVVNVAYQARGSRPVRVELSLANQAIAADTIKLDNYVEYVSMQFPETLKYEDKS